MPTRRTSPSFSTDRVEQHPQSADVARIQELFHGLIRSRAREGRIPVPRRLPSLSKTPVLDRPPDGEHREWFPVNGMYGGFAFSLVNRGGVLQLISESWSRVVGGSGMRHIITPTQIILEAEGFV